ncbi:hypothetical protein [Thermococcus sp.]|uniref:hypothetical protein n=1 Tax=Thermococcus sp. TaxID=35749 RepID=UPI00260376AC|nr:hypothetical protein [Thermococcus sp.]
MDEWERTARVLLDNAREFLEGLRDKVRLGEVTLETLFGVQSTFILGLGDASLYAFSTGRDDVVEDSYGLFLDGLSVLRVSHLLINEPGLGLWLAPLKNLNPERGFSIDKRFSLIGEPKPTMVWANRVVKLRNALHGRPVRDPLYSLGYGIGKGDRRFPVLLKAVRRLYGLFPPLFDEAVKLLLLEVEAGIDVEPLPIINGTIDEVRELPEDIEPAIIGGKEVFYSLSSKKKLHSGLGSIELGKIDALYVKRGKGFMKLTREGF